MNKRVFSYHAYLCNKNAYKYPYIVVYFCFLFKATLSFSSGNNAHFSLGMAQAPSEHFHFFIPGCPISISICSLARAVVMSQEWVPDWSWYSPWNFQHYWETQFLLAGERGNKLWNSGASDTQVCCPGEEASLQWEGQMVEGSLSPAVWKF